MIDRSGFFFLVACDIESLFFSCYVCRGLRGVIVSNMVKRTKQYYCTPGTTTMGAKRMEERGSLLISTVRILRKGLKMHSLGANLPPYYFMAADHWMIIDSRSKNSRRRLLCNCEEEIEKGGNFKGMVSCMRFLWGSYVSVDQPIAKQSTP